MLLKRIAQLLSKMTVPIYSVISNVWLLQFPEDSSALDFINFLKIS